MERDVMIKSLKQNVIPVLREQGFKGSFPHLYRKLENKTDLIMFQFSNWGGVLYVEISLCPSEGIIDSITGKHIPVNKVKVYQVVGGNTDSFSRIRIGKDTNGTFEFNSHNSDEVSYKILPSLEEAEKWWGTYPIWWNN